jgi:hypothetical protein
VEIQANRHLCLKQQRLFKRGILFR